MRGRCKISLHTDEISHGELENLKVEMKVGLSLLKKGFKKAIGPSKIENSFKSQSFPK